MTQREVKPDHETAALKRYDRQLGMYALFEEMMAYVDDGKCTFDQAIEQFKHDLGVGDGIPPGQSV